MNRPRDYQKLFLDMNSFFASVEKQVQPTIRNIPVGVTPYTGNTGCIIAACYQAKDFGVKTGCRVGEAKKLCPNIKIIKARPALYIIYHKEIKKIIESFSPFYIPLSVDEFAISLSEEEQNKNRSLKIGKRIKEKIKEEVGDYLTCSVGIGPSKLLAKMAAESHKPDGLTILELENLEEFYSKLKLTNIPGIGKGMKKRLNQININNSLEFYQADINLLKRHLGVIGRSWYFNLRGYELNSKIKNKSIGHSSVLAPIDRNKKNATQVLRKLTHKVGERSRKGRWWAEGVRVSINFLDRSSFNRSKKVTAFNDNRSLDIYVDSILKNCSWSKLPLKVGLLTFNLTKGYNGQLNIFKDIEKSREISKTIDKINSRFGNHTISYCSAFEAKNKSPNRIAFGQPNYEMD